jgi:predicted RNA-binding Zn ribbon-like protein
MTVKSGGPTLFDLSGGHPALDLVNSLDNRFRADGPNEILVSYGDLLRFLQESGLLSVTRARALSRGTSQDAGEQTLQSVRELREAAAAVLYAGVAGRAPLPADIRTLEFRFLEAARHRELHWEPPAQSTANPDSPAAITWQWSGAGTDPDLPVWILSQTVSDLLLSEGLARVRTCAVDTCRWLFLDTSKNHTRRWCNMKVCGNRMKARRFQARREG